MILIPSPDSMHELQRVWWRDVPTLDVFHIVILLFLPRSGSISLTPLTGHWPCEAKSPDPWAWATWRTCMRSRSIFFKGKGASLRSDTSLQIHMNDWFCAYQPLQAPGRSLQIVSCPVHATVLGSHWRSTRNGSDGGQQTSSDGEKIAFSLLK